MRVIEEIATLVNAYQNCVESGNNEWKLKHLEAMGNFEKEHFAQRIRLKINEPLNGNYVLVRGLQSVKFKKPQVILAEFGYLFYRC